MLDVFIQTLNLLKDTRGIRIHSGCLSPTSNRVGVLLAIEFTDPLSGTDGLFSACFKSARKRLK